MKQLAKLPSLIKINYKNILSNRMVIVNFTIFAVLLALVCSGLISDYKQKSSIPVGIVDEDQSSLSKSVIQKLSLMDGVVLKQGSEEEMKSALKDEMIFAYFVIKPDFENSLNAYEFEKLVQMVYLGQNQFISILSDIFAQAMIGDVVIKAGENLYQDFPEYENLIYSTDYLEFMKNEYANHESSFAFDYQFFNVNEKGMETSKEIENNMISTEMFIALGGIFLTFFVMQLIATMDKNKMVIKRTHLSLISWWTLELADILTLIITEGMMALLVIWYLFHHLSISIGNHLVNLLGMVSVYMFSLTLLFVILRRIFHSKIVYQFTGFVLILTMGGFSILQLLGQFRIEWVSELAKKIPNYWFIAGITDIILGGKTINRTDILYTLASVLLVYALITFAKYRKLEK